MFEWMLVALLSSPTDVDALLAAADRPRAAFVQGVTRIRSTVHPPERTEVITEFDLHVADGQRQLIVFTDPKNRGRRILLIGEKAWLTTPGTTHPVPISASQRLAGGASYAEIARVRLAGDYRGQLRAQAEPCLEEARPGAANAACRVVDISAVTRAARYPAAVLWIDEQGLVRRAEYRHANGRPAKSVVHEYREREGQPVLARSVIRDRLDDERGQITRIEYLEYRREAQPASLFEPPPPADPDQSPR